MKLGYFVIVVATLCTLGPSPTAFAQPQLWGGVGPGDPNQGYVERVGYIGNAP